MRTDTEKLALLLSILNDYSDTVDGADGEPEPNMAMGILCDYEMRLRYDRPSKSEEQNPYMELGARLEPAARASYEALNGADSNVSALTRPEEGV